MKKKEQDFKPGERCFYSEEGGVTRCEIAEIEHEQERNWLNVTLKAIGTVKESPTVGSIPVGQVFTVSKKLGEFIPFAMWEITEDSGSESDRPNDWQKVVDRQPKGYLELNDGNRVLHGPIESIRITDEDFVEIRLKWAATMELHQTGIPSDKWQKASDTQKTILFPNLVVPFEFEQTPEKGPRVRFGFNILYLNEVGGGWIRAESKVWSLLLLSEPPPHHRSRPSGLASRCGGFFFSIRPCKRIDFLEI